MSYQLHYIIDFKNVDDNEIIINIYEKSYGGSTASLNPSASPVTIDYQSGDFYANDPIRASTAKVRYLNDGTIPITTFASQDDTKYYCTISMNKPGQSSTEVWRGFLSQDDSIEDLTPTPNEVELTFTDGLGMMRTQYFTDLSGNLITGQITLQQVFYYILYGQVGLNLPVRIFCNLFENGMTDRTASSTADPFKQTVIDASTFLLTAQTVQDYASGPNAQVVQLKDKVQDCYTIMQNVLDAWGCTIIQADGFWNIIRWHELKQFNNAIPGTQYNADFTSPTAVTFSNIKVIQNPAPDAYYQCINMTQSRQLFRGNQFTRLTFNFKQPLALLLNSDLTSLGTLIATTTTGSGTSLVTKKTYGFNDWIISPDNSTVTYPLQTYIAVEFNYLGVEMQRYAVLQSGDLGQSIWATAFKVNVNDRGNFSFRIQTPANNVDPGTLVFNIKIFPPGTTNFSIHGGVPFWGLKINSLGQTSWSYNSSGYAYSHGDLQPGADVSIDLPVFPMDGVMLIQLPQAMYYDLSGSYTTYANLNLTIYYYIAGSLQVTGQYHESQQTSPIKKTIDKIIYLDDAVKDDIQGVMFLADGATKTSSWKRWPLTEAHAFGWIQTVDWMYLTNKIRSKISGNYKGLTDNTNLFLSALSVIQLQAIANGNYIFGPCSFDFKNNEFSGTIQEVYFTGEYSGGYTFPGTEFTNSFSYLFSAKQ